MKITVKRQILTDINALPIEDLMQFISNDEISLKEMIDAGLRTEYLDLIQARTNERATRIEETVKSKTLCEEIENNKHDVEAIHRFLINGNLTEDDLLQHTSLTLELISKIRNHVKMVTPFQSWKDLPPLEANRTDLYFFGQPGSGKSCILASLFHYFTKEGILIENMSNPTGARYRHQLETEIGNGVLPHSTAKEGVNYIPLELRNTEDRKLRHPLNFIEMSGELFNEAYEKGIGNDTIGSGSYLSNSNRKIIFFVIDFDRHMNSAPGPSQANKSQAILDLLDTSGTLSKTDAIYILISKADLFPGHTDKLEYARNFLNDNYKNFIENCKDKKSKYRDQFKLIVYPYSIGEVKFQNLLTEFNNNSPSYITEAIMNHSFVKKKSFLGRLSVG